MRKRSSNEDSAPGHDSFLDVMTSLVGILIILVMIIAASAKEAHVEAGPAQKEVDGFQASAVATLKSSADGIERDINETADKIKRQSIELAYRAKEREKILLYLTVAEKKLAEEREKLDSGQQQELDLRRGIEQLEQQIESLRVARDAAETATASTAIIQHLPTPMAKTVFGKELHFRLQGGRLTYIPWDDLVAKLKEEARQKVWKLKDVPSLTEDAGPIGGFRMRYTLKRVDYAQETKLGPVVQRGVELDRFELIPVSENLGEPFQKALQPNSEFFARITTEDARQTTVTVWVYPDNFDEFRALKTLLFDRGFLTAARPLPEGLFIGGSPHGSRSASQ